MTNVRLTKKALLMSFCSLVLCLSMLVGTTFAWFTDSVTSSGNVIQTGTLDVAMYYADGTKAVPAEDSAEWLDASVGAIFKSDKWEPGYIEAKHIKIANEGTLALKYELSIVPSDEVSILADVIDVYFLPTAVQLTDRKALTDDAKVGTLRAVIENPAGLLNGALEGETESTVTIALKMRDEAGNKYQNLSIGSDFTLYLFATQETSEQDSFDDQYDAGAELPSATYAKDNASLAEAIKSGTDIVRLGDDTYTLPSGVSGTAFTLIGNGDTEIDLSKATTQSGNDITFENLTVKGSNADYVGIQHSGNLVYNNVVFNGANFLYGESVTFNNCTFNLTTQYMWTYGASEVTFNNCTFNTDGKAILVYNEGTVGSQTVNVNDCTFKANKTAYTSAGDACAVVEIDSSLIPGTYTVNYNGTNTIDTDFSGSYRIKNAGATNVVIHQNGIIVEKDFLHVWDGVTTSAPKQDANGVYQISNGEELAYINEILSGVLAEYGIDVVIVNDFDLGGHAFTPIGQTLQTQGDNRIFTGSFDGNGHTIYNLKVAVTEVLINGKESGAGLFGVTTNAQIKDLTLANVEVSGVEYVGAFVGLAQYSTISGCKVIGGDEGGTITGEEKVGGLVGDTCGGTIDNCSVESISITGKNRVGGITGRTRQDGAAPAVTNSKITNSAIVITEDQTVDYIVGQQLVVVDLTSCSYENVTITKLTKLSTADDLVAVAEKINEGQIKGGTITLESDIDMTGKTWESISVTAGDGVVIIDGNGYTITGLTAPLVGSTWAGDSGLIIKNLTIADSQIADDVEDSEGNVAVGAFIGYPQASETVTLENCHLVNSTVKGGHWTGGLIGMAGGYNGNDGPVFMNLTIKNCSVKESTVEGKGSVGGIIGHAACAAWTKVVIEGCEVSDNTITSTGSSEIKAGSIMGTVGAAGSPATADGETRTGGIYVNSTTVSGNTVTSSTATIDRIAGRLGTPGGKLYMDGEDITGTLPDYQ